MITFNKPALTSVMLFIPFRIFCQLFEWTTPVPLTDSLTDNRNAIVMDLNFYDGSDYYVFWEKSFDTASTYIYTRKYYSQDDPVALTDGDHHFINPCILKTDNWSIPPNEPSFYLFYLSDQDGDFDIYYRTYNTDGLSEQVLFTNTDSDERHLSSNSINDLAWEYEGEILHSRLAQETWGAFYFTDVVVVDSGNCKNPVLEPISSFYYSSFLAWEKEIADSSKVMISQWDCAVDGWEAPQMVYDTGHNTNLRFEESTWSEVWPTLSWERLDATGNRKIICYDPFYLDYFNLEMDQQQEYYPTVFNIFVGVSDIWFFALLSFIKEENGQTEVYGGEQSNWPESYLNLSNSSAIETNTHLWNGMMYYYEQDVINIWESWRNGHWQLYSSKILVPISGSVEEKNQKKQVLLNVAPNPFTDQITLSFKSEITGKASIILYDETGREIGILSDPEIDQGDQSRILDPEKITGRKLPAGIYFIRLEIEGKVFSVKLVKSGG